MFIVTQFGHHPFFCVVSTIFILILYCYKQLTIEMLVAFMMIAAMKLKDAYSLEGKL